MKTIIALSLLICVVVCEYCDHDSDCKLTTCGSNFRLDCYRDNVCTCLPTGGSNYDCPTGSANECEQKNGHCDHGDHHWHCVDKRCHCRFLG